MTEKKKAALLISSLALIAVIVVGGTLAYFTSQDTRENIVTLGKVEGTLTETGENERPDKTTGKDYPNVMPGDVLEKDPTITLDSQSAPAYVRVQIDYNNPNNQPSLTDAQIAELEGALKLNAGWRKSGDYYYYNQTLDNTIDRKTTTIFNEVTIPNTWGNEMATKTFYMNVKAQLVQADNFTVQRANPDGTGDIIGWENVEFEQQQ